MIDFKQKYSNTNKVLASPYDKRDYKFSDQVPLAAFVIPKNYSTATKNYVFDQGQTSMCAACSLTNLRYMQEQDQSQITMPFSPAFTYANRITGEDFEGMYIRSLCKKSREGVLPYELLPGFFTYKECKRKFNANKAKYLEEAAPFATTSFYQCNTRVAMQQAIMMYKGIVAGIYVYDSLYYPDKDGTVKYNPSTDTANYGGHCILLAGWKTDDATGKLYWRLINSWGREYGVNGEVWLPEEYPMMENPYSIVDEEPGMLWESYKEKFGVH